MILIEAKFYPFILMSVRGDRHAEGEYGAMFDAFEAISRTAFRNKTRHICISASSGSMSASERKFVASRIAAMSKEMQSTSITTYVIVESSAYRGVLTALRWLAPGLVPIEAVASVETAMTGASATFERHGIQIDHAKARGARQWLEKAMPQTSTVSA